MKTKNANPFSCHHFDTAWFKKTNVLLIIGLLLLIFCSAPIIAQEQSENRILETKSFLSNLRIREQNSGATYSKADALGSLLYEIQPSVYFYEGTVNTYGEKPTHLFTNISSLNNLNNADIIKNNIQIVTVRIENTTELNSSIDLSILSSFRNLKYVYVLSEINTTPAIINRMVSNNNKNYSVFYSILVGDHNNQ